MTRSRTRQDRFDQNRQVLPEGAQALDRSNSGITISLHIMWK